MSRFRLQNAIGLGMLIALVLSTQISYALSEIMPNTAIKLKIKREWRGNHSGYTKAISLVIYAPEQWKEVWKKTHFLRLPQPELPKIDFEKEMVIAVFMGERSSGGYDIKIIDVFKKEKEIVVVVEETEPPVDSLRTMALTSPYHIVTVKKSLLPVKFQSR